jgi:hypothetical protein
VAKTKGYVYTDLSVRDALTLEIEGKPYQVSQFSSSWAVNEVPSAVAMLTIGRNARTGADAAINANPDQAEMRRCKVWFHPRQEYAPGRNWPEGRRVIFDGFTGGLVYRKVNGRVTALMPMSHWLAALSFSSCLTKTGHVANPTTMNAAAVMSSFNDPNSGEGNYVSALVPAQVVATNVGTDLWQAIKEVFCAMADVPTMVIDPSGQCDGTGKYSRNDTALGALARIEGPVSDGLVSDVAHLFLGGKNPASKPYKWGVPLKIDSKGVSPVEDAIALAIGKETIEGYASVTFWDKLITQFCPMFGMAVVPMVDSTVVVADTPALSSEPWRTLGPDEYDSFDMSTETMRPLRAVGVMARYASPTGAGEGPQSDAVGGCFSEDSVSEADGTVMYVAPPPWLEIIYYQGSPAYVRGLKNEGPDGKAPGPPSTFGLAANDLYRRYAHTVFVNQMLRGRTGTASGKLRFDVAPGSTLKFKPSSERLRAGEDKLAFGAFGCVARVTVAVNAEAALAGVTYSMTHMRSEEENARKRSGVTEHPLFGKAIHGGGRHGAPLVDDYLFG